MIYLNNAATSYPKPDCVLKAVNDYMKHPPFHSYRGTVASGFPEQNILDEFRKNLCSFFNADKPENIIFTSGATESLNLAVKGLELSGKTVVTTETEHNSVLRPLKILEKAGAIKLKIIPCDLRGFVPPEIIEETLNENIGAVVLNHSSNVIGTVQDAKAISALSKKHNIPFILDASQSAGSIDIDISDINPDIFVFTGHKSLFALRGTGGLYIKHDIELKPLITGGTGIQSDYMYQPEWRPVYYEAGTQNIPGIASLNAGVEFLKDTGKKLLNRKKDLFLNIVKFMLDDKRFILYGGKELSDFSSKIPVLSFNMKGLSPEDLGYMLEGSFGIIARTGLHCAPLIHKRIGSFPKGSVRISLSVFNTEEEIDALINALKEIVLTV